MNLVQRILDWTIQMVKRRFPNLPVFAPPPIIPPPKPTLCQAFQTLSKDVYAKLRSASAVGFELSEPTVTELCLEQIGTQYPDRVRVVKFTGTAEGKNGADWEWLFVGKSHHFKLRVQAKKLYLKDMEYGALKSSDADAQCDKLIKSANKDQSFPLYVFYNSNLEDLTGNVWRCGSYSMNIDLLGCTTMSAYSIRESIKNNQIDLADLLPKQDPWSCLVCCTLGSGNRSSELHEQVKKRIEFAYADDEVEIPELIPNEKLPYYVGTGNYVNDGPEGLAGVLIIRDSE
ncbi:hypothetical protein AZI86_07180 [Bdellovibrio bacteriovorus]|uniref:Uncharacterized protein n=1 Tax=Bdellovibrio bacteriovorus TaxID=959 RepID=A0A150WQP2_BDEBC|nr:DUF6615 family protein [Bdellovibrio bacteriovorus]KYG66813.1 hypothetical protein AZI86_07180 [Bdellovibrio bacteriovorus]